jgi:hypothetical protein
MGCCSSIAGAVGVDAPEISEEQLAEIANIVFNEVGSYTPKFSVAFCAILCEESKKQRKGGPPAVLELKSNEINKMTEQSIKMADDPEFDPTTTSAKKQEEEDKEENMREKVEGAVDAALEELDDDGDDDGSGAESKVTSETVRDAVVPQLGSIRADLISKMGSVPEAISGKVVDAALRKAVEKLLFTVLSQFATLHVAEWNKLIKKHKNPKRVFKRGQKICKTIKDIKSLKDNVTDFLNAVQDGNALDAAKAAKGAYDDGNQLKDDKQNMEQIKKNKDDSHSHSGGGD